VRFRPLGPYDFSGLDIVVEVRSKWCTDRAGDRQARCDLLRNLLVPLIGDKMLGIYLSLPVAAWAQM